MGQKPRLKSSDEVRGGAKVRADQKPNAGASYDGGEAIFILSRGNSLTMICANPVTTRTDLIYG